MNKINDVTIKRAIPVLKSVFYPGSGKDLDTLMFILSDLKNVEDIIYCDYIEHISVVDLATLSDWELIKEISLTPSDFGKQNWGEFWYQDKQSNQFAQPNQKESTLFILLNKKSHKLVRFYQLGTEGVGTYKVLCESGHRPNLILLADHGFGCNWDPNIWGEPESHSGKISFLKQFARNNRFLMVDKTSTNPWSDYLVIPLINNIRWNLYTKNRNS
jgi:hypothetical protein